MRISDWSSDVCSSDLPAQEESIAEPDAQAEQALADDVDRNVAAFIDRSIDQARTSRTDDTQVDSAQVAAPIPVAAGGRGGFEIPGVDVDEELRDVFLEDFGEEIDKLARIMTVWRERPDDIARLRTIRSVFHTLTSSRPPG